MRDTIVDSRPLRSPARDSGSGVRIVLWLALAGLVGCSRGGPDRPSSSAGGDAARGPVAVEMVSPDSATTGRLVLAARVKAREEATIASRVAGRVTAILAHEGEGVHAGQPLARFDAPESRAALAAAQHEQAAAEQELTVATRQAARMDSLFGRGVVTARERELADSERESAAAHAQTARATREEVAIAAAPVAPFAGVIVRRHVDVGADVAPGAPLFDMRSTEGVEIVVPVPESALPAVPGARWAVESPTGAARAARLTSLDGMTDPATRTRTAHLAPISPQGLEPGAFARVSLTSPRLAPALASGIVRLLPQSALVRRGALRGVFVLTPDGHAELRWLKVADDDANPVEVLSGLFPGERVARTAEGLADGTLITARP